MAKSLPRLKKSELRSGPLAVTIELDEDGTLHSVTLPKRIPEGLDSAALSGVLAQLEKFPIAMDSAPFVKKVRQRMRKIPWGSALTYSELAVAAGSARAARAVGQACATNKLLLIVPCHRVLASVGLGGFACGLPWKTKLLELETEKRPA